MLLFLYHLHQNFWSIFLSKHLVFHLAFVCMHVCLFSTFGGELIFLLLFTILFLKWIFQFCCCWWSFYYRFRGILLRWFSKIALKISRTSLWNRERSKMVHNHSQDCPCFYLSKFYHSMVRSGSEVSSLSPSSLIFLLLIILTSFFLFLIQVATRIQTTVTSCNSYLNWVSVLLMVTFLDQQ